MLDGLAGLRLVHAHLTQHTDTTHTRRETDTASQNNDWNATKRRREVEEEEVPDEQGHVE